MSPWQDHPHHDRGPRRVGESLDRVTGGLGAPSASAVEAIFSHWETVVGANVADHARPRALRDTTLVVAVDEPAWATQLRWLEADLLAQLATVVGEGRVTAIEVRVVPS